MPDGTGDSDSDAQHSVLALVIEELAPLLPAQGPISIFIHHNTLHAFQHLPFHEALAAASATFEPDTDFRVSITNAPGAEAYPASSFTWLLVRPDRPEAGRARAMKQFLEWMITDEAQQMAAQLHYAPLPKPVAELVAQRIQALEGAGAPIR